MTVKCSNCGADNRDTARYCGVCGSKITLPAAPQPPRMPLPAPPPGTPAPSVPGQVAPYQPQPQPAAPYGQPVGFPKLWKGPQPRIEGRVVHVEAPVQEKGSVAGKVVVAGCLAIIAPILAFLPFVGGTQVTVRYLRVEDYQTGQQRSVKMRGEPSGIISVGDWLAIWGKEEGGNIVMTLAFNYTTDAEIRLKT